MKLVKEPVQDQVEHQTWNKVKSKHKVGQLNRFRVWDQVLRQVEFRVSLQVLNRVQEQIGEV